MCNPAHACRSDHCTLQCSVPDWCPPKRLQHASGVSRLAKAGWKGGSTDALPSLASLKSLGGETSYIGNDDEADDEEAGGATYEPS